MDLIAELEPGWNPADPGAEMPDKPGFRSALISGKSLRGSPAGWGTSVPRDAQQ